MDYTCSYCRLNFGTEELRDKHHTQCGPSLLIKIQIDQATRNLWSAKMEQIVCENISLKNTQKNLQEVKKHQCAKCSYQTDRKDSLKKHKLVHSKEGARIFKCKICNLRTHLKGSFKRHLMIHNTNIKTFDCHICDYKTKRKDVLKQHMLYHDRPSKKMYSCDVCDYTSVYKGSIKLHSAIHYKSNKQYICYHCNLKTSNKGTLRKHLQQKHSSTKEPIKCPSCKKEFSLKNTMDNHILQAHPQLSDLVTSKVHSCTDCSYKTTLFGNLRSHQIKHSKENLQAFKCNICDYIGYRKNTFVTHMLVHKGIKKFTCTKCKNQFTQDSHLAAHILSHHGTSEKLLKTITRKFYTCKYCKYKNLQKKGWKHTIV